MRCPDSERSGRILVASDFSGSADEAVRQAEAWARRQQAELVALHLVPAALPVHPLFPQRQQRDVTDLVTLERGLAQELSDRIRRLSESSRDEVDVAVDFGDPYAAIVRHAEEVGVTPVVVGSMGAADLTRMHLVSVAEKGVH